MATIEPKRILFIRPSALGDVCRSVPVVESLHAAYPDADIDWLVQSEFIDAIEAHPAIHRAIPFPRKELHKWYLPRGLKMLKGLASQLKANNYDVVIDGQGLGRSGLLTLATGAQTRIGPNHAREFGWLGYTNRVQTTSPHTVDSMLELVENIGVPPIKSMQLYTPQFATQWWEDFRRVKSIQEYAVLAPTSRWMSKQWPVERYCEVAQYLQSEGKQVVIVGAPSEEEQVTELIAIDGVINLLPELSVGCLLAVIEKSAVLVGNDSAAIHIGVGFNTPLIGLYGPTNPIEVGPYGQQASVIAAPVNYSKVHYRDSHLGDAIMRHIQTKTVIERLAPLLSGQHAS